MEPKVLANALVEAGIGRHWATGYKLEYDDPVGTVVAETFITDWRVAGKCLESMWVDVCHNNPEFLEFVNNRINGKSIHELPRAIIEAWYAAQKGEGESDEQGEDND